jgi:hypothetical protein
MILQHLTPFLSLLPFYGRSNQRMDHSQEQKETNPKSSADDTKDLVTALTGLLLDDQPLPPRISEHQPQTDPQMHTVDTTTPDAILRNFTSTSSSNDGDEGQTSLLPGFLADSQVRAALHRADSLRPQGHLSDEPYFPSSFMGVPPHYQDGREQEGNQPRDFHPPWAFLPILIRLTRLDLLLLCTPRV